MTTKAKTRPLAFDHQIIQAVGKADLVPDYTELLDIDAIRAAVDAFIAERFDPEAPVDFRSYDDVQAFDDRDEAVIAAALSEAVQGVFGGYRNRATTMRWVQEEIAYALGVAVGRRLGGTR